MLNMFTLFLSNLVLLTVITALFNFTRFKKDHLSADEMKYSYLDFTLIILSSILTNVFGMIVLCVCCYAFPSVMILVNLYLLYLASKPFMISGMHKINLF